MRTSKAQFPTLSYPDYKDYRDRNTVLSGLAMYRFIAMNMSRGAGKNVRLWGYEVSGNYFDMLGVQPIRGRVLHPADDVKRGGHPVAVISYSCWQARFGGDPDIAGKKVKDRRARLHHRRCDAPGIYRNRADLHSRNLCSHWRWRSRLSNPIGWTTAATRMAWWSAG